MKIKKSLQAAGLRTVYDYVDKDPRARLPQVVSLLEKFVPAGSDMDGVIRGIQEGPGGPGQQLEPPRPAPMGRHRRRRAARAL